MSDGYVNQSKFSSVRGLNFKSFLKVVPYEELRPSVERIRELRERRLVDQEQLNSVDHIVDWMTRTKSHVISDRPSERGRLSPFQELCPCMSMPSTWEFSCQQDDFKCGPMDILHVPSSKRVFPILRFTMSRTKWKYPTHLDDRLLIQQQRCSNVLHSAVRNHLNGMCNQEKFKSSLSICEKRMCSIYHGIRSAMSATLVHVTGWLLLNLLPGFFTSISVSGSHLDALRAAHNLGLPIVYLPTHRSHLDYILLPFFLWYNNLPVPFVAAGDNLNIPVVGPILRRLGGFFIRRTPDREDNSPDNRYYEAVLQTYMETLLIQGANLEFYLEAGRSRTGRTRPAKRGLLSIVLKAYLDGLLDDVILVPMSITYEMVPDGNYVHELTGGTKVPESLFSSIMALIQFFRGHYGMVRFSFCQPFCISNFVRTFNRMPVELKPARSLQVVGSSAAFLTDTPSPTDTFECISQLADHCILAASRSQCVMVTHVVAFALLYYHRENGCSLSELTKTVGMLADMVRSHTAFSGQPEHLVLRGCRLLKDHLHITAASKDHLHITALSSPSSVLQLSYYAQSVLSHLSSPVVLASAFSRSVAFTPGRVYDAPVSVSSSLLTSQVKRLAELIPRELLLAWPCASLDTEMRKAMPWWMQNMTSVSREYSVHSEEANTTEARADDLVTADVNDPLISDRLSALSGCLGAIVEAYWNTVVVALDQLQVQPVLESTFVANVMYAMKNRKRVYCESLCKEMVHNCVRTLADLQVVTRTELSANKSLLTLSSRSNAEKILSDLEGFLIL